MSLKTNIEVNCKHSIGEVKHIWTSIGFDEINWSYTARGKYLLKTLKGKKMRTYHTTISSKQGFNENSRTSKSQSLTTRIKDH